MGILLRVGLFSSRSHLVLDVFLLYEKIVWSNCHIRWNLSAYYQNCFSTTPSCFWIYNIVVFSCVELWGNFVIAACSLVIPVWEDHPTCVKCRLSAGICTLDINRPCSICESWSTITWGKLRKSLRDARQKSVKRGTQHWSYSFPALFA